MNYWLFQKEKDVLWQQKRLHWYAAWRIILLVVLSVCWGCLLFFVTADTEPSENLLIFVETPIIAVMNVIPAVFLSLLFYAAFARALPAFFASGLTTLGCSVVNDYLLASCDNPIMDFFKGQSSWVTDERLWVVLGGFVLVSLILGIFARGKGAGKKMRLTILVILLLAAYPLGMLYVSEGFLR